MEDVVGAMHYCWNSMDEMWSEEADFMAQLLLNYNSSIPIPIPIPIPINHRECESSSSTLWVGDESGGGLMYESSHVFPSFPNDDGIGNYHHHHHLMDYCTSGHVMGMGMGDDDDVANLSEECMPKEEEDDDDNDFIHGASKKRSRVPGNIPVPRNKRGGVKLSKRPKVDQNNNNAAAVVMNYDNRKAQAQAQAQMMNSSTSCCSEDNCSCSGALATLKTRASRGSATDPQSLYARKRRERINERLKVLQKLVPNGTKVDISTMLEEAVQYVKFLQLQIKLLSSDDLWMYAPIAYNGMDIGALH